MGPYCKYCDDRCFVALPVESPQSVVMAYGTAGLMATCRRGQVFDLEKVGFCHSQVLEIIQLDRAIGLPCWVKKTWAQQEMEDGNGVC